MGILIDATLKNLTSKSEFKQYILKETVQYVNGIFTSSRNQIEMELRKEARRILESSRDYSAAKNSVLRGHLGLRDPGMVDLLVTAVVNNLHVEDVRVALVGEQIRGGYSISIFPAGIDDFDGATFKSEKLGVEVNWVRMWLFGESPNGVGDYRFLERRGLGRSAWGKMVKSDSESWQMPPEYTGNWIARELTDFHLIIDSVVERVIKSANSYKI